MAELMKSNSIFARSIFAKSSILLKLPERTFWETKKILEHTTKTLFKTPKKPD